jgi:large repetitive protein
LTQFYQISQFAKRLQMSFSPSHRDYRNKMNKKSKRRTKTQPLHLQILEQRDNPAPFPSITGLAAPGATRPLLGESVTYNFAFNNPDATLTGFGPYIVVAVDSTGADGAPNPDGFGVPVVRSTGTVLSPLGKTVLTSAKTYDNPFTGQTGLSAPAGYTAGDTIYIYQLPFISFTPDQSTDVDITLPTSNLADVGVPLNLTVIPAFRDTNATAPFSPQISAPVVTDAIPELYRLLKIYEGPEDETATGPNFIRRYRLDVDIATGQTINNLTLTDDLAPSMQIVGRNSTKMAAFVASSGFGTNILNLSKLGGTAVSTAPDGTVTYQFGNVTGVAGKDASFAFDFYVPRDNAAPTGGQVIPQTPLVNANTGTDSKTDTNTASSTGTWTAIDTRDGTISVPKTAPDNRPHNLEEQSIAIQKGFELIDRTTGAVLPAGAPIRPGNTLIRYTMNFQVSDYYAFDNVFVRDSLADGQRLFIGTFGTGGSQSAFPLMTVNNAFLTGSPAGSRITSTSTAAGGLPANRFTGNQVIEYQRRYTGTDLDSIPTSFLDVDGPATGSIGASVFLNQTPAPNTNINTGGSSLIQFNVSQELRARHGANAGRLVGGDIANAGSSPNNNPVGSQLFPGTTGTIVFYAEVTEEFSDAFPSLDRTVDQGDILNNRVDDPTTQERDGIFGQQLRTEEINAATPTIIGRGSDDSGTSVVIPYGVQVKQIYAINGQRVPDTTTTPPTYNVQAGDSITYLLTYSLPISSFENLRLIDLPPLPVINVQTPGTFNFNRDPATYIFNPGNVGVFVNGVTPGSSGTGSFTSDTYFSTFDPSQSDISRHPDLDPDPLRNSLTLDFGTHDDPGIGNRRSTTISVLVTFRVSDVPFAADLPLTNQLRVNEGSTNAGTATVEAIRQFNLVRPFVTIQKGAVGGNTTGFSAGSGSSSVAFDPPSNATGTFTLGGSALSKLNAVDNSTEASNIGGFNITNSNPRVDAGDVVRFAIVAQNSGQGDAFDVNITDIVQPGFDRSTFTNLRLFRGDGTPLGLGTDYNFVYVPGTGALSITLVDNYTDGNISTTPGVSKEAEDSRSGALSRGRGVGSAVTNGSNTIIALYDVTLASTVAPGQTITNTAIVTNYANNDGGSDLTDPNVIPGAGEPQDTATVTVPVNLVKQVVSTSETHTTGSNVAIGEIVRYRLVMELAEGQAKALQLRDQLPSGLTFLNDNTSTVAFVSNGPGITSSTGTISGSGLNVSGTFANAGSVTTVPTFLIPGTAITGGPFNNGTDVTFNLGDVTNADRDTDLEFIVIEFNALVNNTTAGSNDAGETRNNNFQTLVNANVVATSPNTAVTIVEPQITVQKVPAPTTADAGDLITYTITITNANVASSATGYEVRFTDVVPATLTGVGYTVTTPLPSGVSITTDVSAGNSLDILFNQLTPGQSITITVRGNVIPGVLPGQVITNTGNIVYTSLPETNGTTTNPTGSSNTGTPGSDTGERTGSGTAPNDYASSGSGDVTINALVPIKTVLATSETSTTGNDVVIGEVVRYRLVTRVPESSSLTNFRITDALPDGLQFLNDSTALVGFVSNGTGISSSTLSGTGLILNGNETTVGSLTPTFVLPSGALLGGPFTDGTDVIFALGDLNNQDRDADQEFIIIEFRKSSRNHAEQHLPSLDQRHQLRFALDNSKCHCP